MGSGTVYGQQEEILQRKLQKLLYRSRLVLLKSSCYSPILRTAVFFLRLMALPGERRTTKIKLGTYD